MRERDWHPRDRAQARAITQFDFAGDQAQLSDAWETSTIAPTLRSGMLIERPNTRSAASLQSILPFVNTCDRLSGVTATPDGIACNGPVVVWKGRRAVHGQSRRWSSAWSPEQVSQRLTSMPPNLARHL
nr:hypothetical protein [Oceaniovalibus sp. ACAM 378]